jgi:hypothetical protein
LEDLKGLEAIVGADRCHSNLSSKREAEVRVSKLSYPMYITLEHRSCVLACMHVFYSNKLWNSGPSKDLLTLPKQSDLVSLLSPGNFDTASL